MATQRQAIMVERWGCSSTSSRLELIPVLVREGIGGREGRQKPIAILIEGNMSCILSRSVRIPAWTEGLLVCGEVVSLEWGRFVFLVCLRNGHGS